MSVQHTGFPVPPFRPTVLAIGLMLGASATMAATTTVSTSTSSQVVLNNGDSVIVTGAGTINEQFSGVPVRFGAIEVGTNQTAGSISNAGTVIKGNNDSGVYLKSGASLTGGIVNTGSITGIATGIFSANGTVASISNSGQVRGTNNVGIHLGGTTITGDLVNTGTISAGGGGYGILLDSGSSIQGRLFNAGTISGPVRGISVDAASTGIAGNLTNTGTISGGTFALLLQNTGNAFTVFNSGTITGNSNLGINTLTLTGNNTARLNGTVTGTTATINIGDGSTAAAFTPTASLNGAGIAAFNIRQAATLNINTALGITATQISNAGTLNVAAGTVASLSGQYSQTGTLGLGIASPSSYGQVQASGNVTLSGARLAILSGSTLAAGTYTGILRSTGGTLSGNFASGYAYQGADIYQLNTVATPGTPNSLDLTVSPTAAKLTPALAGAQSKATTATVSAVNNTLFARLNRIGGPAYAGTTADNRFWVTPYASHGRLDSNPAAGGYTQDSAGIVFGSDLAVGSNGWLGAALQAGHARLSGNGMSEGSKDSIDSVQLNLYARKQLTPATAMNLVLAYGTDRHDTSRYDLVAASRASAAYDGWHATASAELSHDLALSAARTLSPIARVEYVETGTDAFAETGADTSNLTVGKQNSSALIVSAGVRFTQDLAAGRLSAIATLGQDLHARDDTVTSSRQGSAFTSAIPKSEPTVGHLGLGYAIPVAKKGELSVAYDAFARADSLDHQLSLTVKMPF